MNPSVSPSQIDWLPCPVRRPLDVRPAVARPWPSRPVLAVALIVAIFGRPGWWLAMMLVLGSIVGTARAVAAPTATGLTGQTPPTVLDTKILILRDPTGKLGITEVQAAPAERWFAPSGRGTPTFGFSPDVFWVKFRLRSDATREMQAVVELKASRFEKLDWFVVQGGAVVDTEVGGNLRPRQGLKLRTRLPAFPVLLAPGDEVEVYLRAETQTSILFPITVFSGVESFTAAVVREEWLGFGFGGFTATILVLSLVLGLMLRQALFLLNALISALLIFEYAVFHSYWAWFELPYANYLVRQPTLAIAVALAIGVVLFTRESFSDFPTPARLRRAGDGVLLGLLALMVLVLILPYRIAGGLAVGIQIGTSSICLIATAWFYFVRKKATLRLLLLAWLLNLSLMTVLQLQWYAVIPAWLPVQGAMTEFLGIMALLFLVASMDRFHQLMQGQVRTTLLEQALAEARLRMLRYQVNPHFLFNSLNSAISLAREDARTSDFLRRLAKFLRASLNESAEMTVSLAEEEQTLAAYLDVEKVRFGERLDWSFAISEEAGRCLIPELMLQPLVENAIKHGMHRAPFVLRLRIRARREGDAVWVEVANTGGVKAPDPAAPPREGVGLANLRNRLAMVGKGEAQFTLTQEGEWVVARIRLPFAQRDQNSESRPGAAGRP